MIRTLIIDDEPEAIQDLQLLLNKHPGFFVVGSCGSIEEARVLIPNTNPDLLLLDIELNDRIVFDLLNDLSERKFHVIFVTGHNHYAIKAIKFGAFDYLIKPVDEDELDAALKKIREQPFVHKQQHKVVTEHLNSIEPPNRIVLRSRNYLQVVVFEDILYCEGAGSYTNFFLSDRRKITTSHSIKEYESLLPESKFIRTHQSYLVNYEFIDQLHNDGYLVLKNGTEIPVAVRRKDAVSRMLTGNPRRPEV